MQNILSSINHNQNNGKNKPKANPLINLVRQNTQQKQRNHSLDVKSSKQSSPTKKQQHYREQEKHGLKDMERLMEIKFKNKQYDFQITPEIAATVVQQYLLPMFEQVEKDKKDQSRLLEFGLKEKEKSGYQMEAQLTDLNTDIDVQQKSKPNSSQSDINSLIQYSNTVYGELKLSDQLMQQLKFTKKQLITVSQKLKDTEQSNFIFQQKSKEYYTKNTEEYEKFLRKMNMKIQNLLIQQRKEIFENIKTLKLSYILDLGISANLNLIEKQLKEYGRIFFFLNQSSKWQNLVRKEGSNLLRVTNAQILKILDQLCLEEIKMSLNHLVQQKYKQYNQLYNNKNFKGNSFGIDYLKDIEIIVKYDASGKKKQYALQIRRYDSGVSQGNGRRRKLNFNLKAPLKSKIKKLLNQD